MTTRDDRITRKIWRCGAGDTTSISKCVDTRLFARADGTISRRHRTRHAVEFAFAIMRTMAFIITIFVNAIAISPLKVIVAFSRRPMAFSSITYIHIDFTAISKARAQRHFPDIYEYSRYCLLQSIGSPRRGAMGSPSTSRGSNFRRWR